MMGLKRSLWFFCHVFETRDDRFGENPNTNEIRYIKKRLLSRIEMRTIWCRIHGDIPVNPFVCSVIDTPVFQRLRSITQCGTVKYVYPTANHTRFEHSLGVGYLARKVMKHLQETQPELKITDRQVDLLQLAGTVHDIGHGPYSHVYDSVVKTTHEERGIKMLEQFVDKALTKEEYTFVCNIIMGKGKGFLYQIVANSDSGFDVDKIDYVMRDASSVGFTVNIDVDRLIRHMRVIDEELCFDLKVHDDVFEIYRMRYMLHKKIYQHDTVVAIEYMIRDLMKDIQPSELDTDVVVDGIDHPLMTRLHNRDLYKCVASRIVMNPLFENIDCGKEYILSQRVIGLTSEKEHPMSKVSFFSQGKERMHSTLLLPVLHREVWIRLYSI